MGPFVRGCWVTELFCDGSLFEWVLMWLRPFVLGCYVIGPFMMGLLVMGPYVVAPWSIHAIPYPVKVIIFEHTLPYLKYGELNKADMDGGCLVWISYYWLLLHNSGFYNGCITNRIYNLKAFPSLRKPILIREWQKTLYVSLPSFFIMN